MEQMRENTENYVWTQIKDLEELENLRMSAMRLFLTDFEQGKSENDIFATSFPTGSRMMITAVVNYFKQNHAVEIRKTQYEFQKGGNKMLVIKRICC